MRQHEHSFTFTVSVIVTDAGIKRKFCIFSMAMILKVELNLEKERKQPRVQLIMHNYRIPMINPTYSWSYKTLLRGVVKINKSLNPTIRGTSALHELIHQTKHFMNSFAESDIIDILINWMKKNILSLSEIFFFIS